MSAYQLPLPAVGQSTQEPVFGQPPSSEMKTTVLFLPGTTPLTSNSLEYAIPVNSHRGYRIDTPDLKALRVDMDRLPDYVIEVFSPQRTGFLDRRLVKYFAEISCGASQGRPQLEARDLRVGTKAPLDSFLRDVSDVNPDLSIWPGGRQLMMQTLFGIQYWYELREDPKEPAYRRSRTFMIHYDVTEDANPELSWCVKGSEKWPFSFIATMKFWLNDTFEVSVITDSPQPLVRDKLVQICVIAAWIVKPTVYT